jgi:hypothetical protein
MIPANAMRYVVGWTFWAQFGNSLLALLLTPCTNPNHTLLQYHAILLNPVHAAKRNKQKQGHQFTPRKITENTSVLWVSTQVNPVT